MKQLSHLKKKTQTNKKLKQKTPTQQKKNQTTKQTNQQKQTKNFTQHQVITFLKIRTVWQSALPSVHCLQDKNITRKFQARSEKIRRKRNYIKASRNIMLRSSTLFSADRFLIRFASVLKSSVINSALDIWLHIWPYWNIHC